MKNNFNETVENIILAFKENNISLNRLQAEFICERSSDWSSVSIDDTKDWFIAEQDSCSMGLEKIDLNDCKNWSFDESKGVIKHSSDDFFEVIGVRVFSTKSREVTNGWDQPFLKQKGLDGGILGLLRYKIDNIPYYLVEAKAEPGNPDLVQISPTLQATFANLRQSHGGKKPKFSEYFEEENIPGTKIIFKQWLSEDGGRLYKKRNLGVLAEIDDISQLNISKSFRWVTLFQLCQLIKQNSWVNPHIRSIISSL
jgi:oxidase EvaA